MSNYNLSGHEKMKLSRFKKAHRMIRISSFILIFCCTVMFADNSYTFPGDVSQQQTIITGIVADLEGEPLPGVSVIIKGTTRGTATETNGSYTISVPDDNATLVFSYIGFVSREFQVGNQRVINVTLAEDVSQLPMLPRKFSCGKLFRI